MNHADVGHSGKGGHGVRLVISVMALLCAIGPLDAGGVRAAPDAFYNPPASLPWQPGSLLRVETFTRGIPRGASAWRILYTTTRDDATPAVASALVLAPAQLPAGPRPVIAWTHGTTGVAPQCAPSLLDEPFSAGAAPALDQVIANGWVMVATDYIGLGAAGTHAWLVGQPAARASLDAVRAARQMPQLTLENRVVAWGHSQGGHAALWTGIIAPAYAPDVNLVGIAALAPATDLGALVRIYQGAPLGAPFTAFLAETWSRTYPDLPFDTLVRPEARDAVRQMAALCLTDAPALLKAASQLRGPVLAVDAATHGPLVARLAENTPTGVIGVPLLLAQGRTDTVVPAAVQDAYVARRCAAGQAIEYRTYAGQGHVEVVAPDSPLIPDLVRWTQDRLAGGPSRNDRLGAPPQSPTAGCQTIRA